MEDSDLSERIRTSSEAKMPPKAFRFTHFPKNTSANPLESHTFKTKDLKPFRFIHFQKSGGGPPYPDRSEGHMPCEQDSSLQVPTCQNWSPLPAIACRNRCAYNGPSAVDGAPFTNRMARRSRHQHKIRDAHRKAGTANGSDFVVFRVRKQHEPRANAIPRGKHP